MTTVSDIGLSVIKAHDLRNQLHFGQMEVSEESLDAALFDLILDSTDCCFSVSVKENHSHSINNYPLFWPIKFFDGFLHVKFL